MFYMLFVFGCAMQSATPPESAPVESALPEEIADPSIEVTTEMVEEYARINQISDLKTAEYYLTHPVYARKNPYKPTEEDIAFYEMDFLEKLASGKK